MSTHTFPDFSGSASPQGVDKQRVAATAEEGTARKPVCANAEGNDSRSNSRKKNGRDSRRDGTTFPDGCAASKRERTEASGKPPPGVCRSGASFSQKTHTELVGLVLDLGARLERLERLHRADLAAAIALQRKPTPNDKMQALVALVSERTGVPVAEIMGRKRFETVARARMLAYYVHRVTTGLPLAEIARWWGLDRVSIRNGCRRTKDRMDIEPDARVMVAELLQAAARKWRQVAPNGESRDRTPNDKMGDRHLEQTQPEKMTSK